MKKGLLAVALLGLSLVAGGALAEPKPVIGALIRNLDDQFLGDYTGNLKKLAVSKGVELKVMDAHSDMATQLDQLNTLISQGVKYFVVVPAVTEGSEQLASIIAAKKGGAAFSNTAPTVAALKKTLAAGADMILVTGGMSVDPDDKTPAAIRALGCDVVVYGAPVFPGAMFMLGYKGEVPVFGLPGCVMYHHASILDLVMPRILAGLRVTAQDIVDLAHGGLCLGCEVCHYPNCVFGKG